MSANPLAQLLELGPRVDAAPESELIGAPEATILWIVENHQRLKNQGVPEGVIFTVIDRHRSMMSTLVSGGEDHRSKAAKLPSGLDLERYAEYRVHLEYPGVPGLGRDFIYGVVGAAQRFFAGDGRVVERPPVSPTQTPSLAPEADWSDEPQKQFRCEDEDILLISDARIIASGALNLLANADEPDLNAMVGLGRLIYGLGRLPDVVEGLDVEFCLSYEAGNEEFKESRSWSVALSDQACQISTGGWIDTAGVGPDSLPGESLYLEVGGQRASDDMDHWIDGARLALESGAQIAVHNDSDASMASTQLKNTPAVGRPAEEEDARDSEPEEESAVNTINHALSGLRALLTAAGQELGEADRALLLGDFEPLDDAGKKRVLALCDDAFTGFFHLAAKGHAFVPAREIEKNFGRSLAENYPSAGRAFLRFAKTFWTFKLMQGSLLPAHRDKALSILLSEIEMNISSVFFPTPGPAMIPTQQREGAQREMLKASDAPIDIDAFIAGNPILWL